jgi:hypothetical protein
MNPSVTVQIPTADNAWSAQSISELAAAASRLSTLKRLDATLSWAHVNSTTSEDFDRFRGLWAQSLPGWTASVLQGVTQRTEYQDSVP